MKRRNQDWALVSGEIGRQRRHQRAENGDRPTRRFASGRQSAWLGMTPRDYSSGNTRKLGHISRQGNLHVRTLLTHGAQAALLAAQRLHSRAPERLTQLQRWAVATAVRIGHNKAAVALANKLCSRFFPWLW